MFHFHPDSGDLKEEVMKNRIKLGLLLGVWLTCLFFPVAGGAFSTNPNHKLGAYSLYQYGTYNGVNWKDTVTPSYYDDPAGLFWDVMTGGTSSEYANSDSRRRVNAQVNYNTIFPIPGSSEKNWNKFDLVFFFGHNNMITPPHECVNELAFWSNSSGTWNHISGNWCDWGTAALPYEYYYQDLTSGKSQPGAVVYLYEPFTSALLGYQFLPGSSWVVQKTAQDTPGGNSPGTTITCTGGLGGQGLKWLILHGCQAVIVANQDGSAYNPMGVQAFRRTWEGFHIILGHYRSYYTSQMKDLQPFADALRAGVPVQAAYFLTDPASNSSAISAERAGVTNFMDSDTWTAPQANISGKPNLWRSRWIRQVGTTADYWSKECN
jgi:hypothetical protein